MTIKQTWNAKTYQDNASFVSDLGGAVIRLLDPKPAERILDLGCGDGTLMGRIAATGANIIGVDTSRSLLAAATSRGLDVREMSGTKLKLDHGFDAVFSNAVLHWINEPELLINQVHTVLNARGRFVGEFGGHGNVAAIVTAMRAVALRRGADMKLAGPWFFPTHDEYRGLLERDGFDVQCCELHPRPTLLPSDMAGWLLTFRKPFFEQFNGAEREKALKETLDLLAPSLCDTKGQWSADYVRLRFHAVKI